LLVCDYWLILYFMAGDFKYVYVRLIYPLPIVHDSNPVISLLLSLDETSSFLLFTDVTKLASAASRFLLDSR
jgi:hypothetical protein